MGDGTSSASLTKKKLPFKATALRKAAALKSTPAKEAEKKNDDDGLDLFRQSKEMESIIATDRERKERKMRKKQKEVEDKERRLSGGDKRPLEVDQRETPPPPPMQIDDAVEEHRAVGEDTEDHPLFSESVTMDGDSFRDLVTPPPSKRSRLGSAQGSRSSKRHRGTVDVSENPFDDSPSKRSLRSRSLITPTKKPRNDAATPSGAPLITLDSDSDDDIDSIAVETPSKRRDDGIEIVGTLSADPASSEPAPEPPVEEEDEFAEYVRKAAEQRARNEAMVQTDANGAPKKEAVELVITSQIPETRVAIIKYQFDRPLRLVRDSWIALQRRKNVHLPITNDNDIVLTWQGEKVYASSTLLSLGIRPQGDGRIIADEYGKGGLSDGRTKVNMVAWTVEKFQEEEELRQKREAGEPSDDEVEDEAERVRLRVKLKARDMEEVKLTVLLETTVETLITGFRTQRGIGPDKDVGIWFDGARLEEHETMESADINDMDSLEVHIK